jgi:hypothetical protein
MPDEIASLRRAVSQLKKGVLLLTLLWVVAISISILMDIASRARAAWRAVTKHSEACFDIRRRVAPPQKSRRPDHREGRREARGTPWPEPS